MTDEKDDTQFAARVALEILERVQDGQKLLAVHKYYPAGTDAFRVGAWLGMGALFGCSAAILAGTAIAELVRFLVGVFAA